MGKNRAQEEQEGFEGMGLGLRVGIGVAVAAGALVSGFLASRRGRRLVADTFRGRRPSPLADRVLDRLWDDAILGRRRLDVEEPVDGRVVITGSVASDEERARVLELARGVAGVTAAEDRLVLDPTIRRRRVRRLEPQSSNGRS